MKPKIYYVSIKPIHKPYNYTSIYLSEVVLLP